MRIQTRIACGYAVVLGLAFVGTAVGLAVGSHYQRQASEERTVATAERKLLADLQVKILYNRPAKQLSPHLGNPVRLQDANQRFLERIADVKALLQEHKDLHENLSHHTSHVHDDELNLLLGDYALVVDRFYERSQSLAQTLSTLSNMPEDLEKANQLLLAFVQSPEFLAFIEFPEQLEPFMEGVEGQEQQAEAALRKAESLRFKIIVGSIVASVVLATVMALFTSRAIAQPIQSIIHVAQRVAEENNFELQVPVATQGEVGVLAQSLNHLIQQVNRSVEELRHKNDALEQALDQVGHQQMQLVQAEKMSSLGQLVAGVAHEINNPVNFIHGNLPYVQDYAQDLLHLVLLYQVHYPNPDAELQAIAEEIDLEFLQTDLPKMLESIQLGTNRIRQIVLSLRNFSRMDEAEFKAVDIHEGLDSTLMILQHRLKDKPGHAAIQVQKDYGNLPLVECYAGQINQVFMNILANAIDALDEVNTGTPSELDLRQIKIRTSVLPSNWIEIAIADTGPGIPEKVQPRIFDPFFTTKPTGKGTGIGMSLSYQIITEKHGGKLECFSTPGEGTEFIIQIPIQQESAAAA